MASFISSARSRYLEQLIALHKSLINMMKSRDHTTDPRRWEGEYLNRKLNSSKNTDLGFRVG
jgi:hypothetical protein